jgi:chemosensory pili system protein ChpE
MIYYFCVPKQSGSSETKNKEHTMNLIFLSAFLAGLAYCAAPGVINAEAIRRALTHGFRAALLFQVGALAGDALWAAVALSGVVVIRPSAGLQLILGICGAFLLVWLAWGAMRDFLRGHVPMPLQPSRHDDLLLGALLSLANPFAGVFWLSIGGSLLPADALTPELPTVAIMVGAFILATMIWSVLLATVASNGRRWVRATTFRWLNAGASVCMALFGFGLFWQMLAAL